MSLQWLFFKKIFPEDILIGKWYGYIFTCRDARGMTPFMSAVSGRAYPAAITILETAQKVAKGMDIFFI